MNADTGSTGISYGVQNRGPVFPEGRSMCSGKIRAAEVIVTKCHHAITPVIPPVTARFSGFDACLNKPRRWMLCIN